MRLTGRTKRIVALATVTILTGFASSAWAQNPEMAGTSSGEGISGGPSTAEAQRALQNRIEQQSSGRITLLSFKPTATKFADVELENRVFCLLEFEAQVGFTEPCRWAFQSGGRPLTFNTLKPREQSALVSAMPGQAIEVAEVGERFLLRGSVWFSPGTNGWTLAGFGKLGTPMPTFGAQGDACIVNLKQIGLAFRMWSMDNGDHFPFNVGTNAGGTLEFCGQGSGNLDTNGFLHFRAMSNMLHAPVILVCPADSSKQPAISFQGLQASNVSYQVRSGTNVDENNPLELLARCPVHGHILRANGSVEVGGKSQGK